MSDGKTSGNNPPANNPFVIAGLRTLGNLLPPQVKDSAILVGWIAGLLLIAGLSWFLTQPLRSNFLLRAVNRVLEQSGDPRRLGVPVPPGALKIGFSRTGFWYTMAPGGKLPDGKLSDGSKAFIFTFFGEGTFFPCVAMVDSGGKVEEIIPLNSHGEKMIQRVSPGFISIYTRRIEGAE